MAAQLLTLAGGYLGWRPLAGGSPEKAGLFKFAAAGEMPGHGHDIGAATSI
jgi:hypothetical protein